MSNQWCAERHENSDTVCHALPPCWDVNCWPCCDSLGISSKPKAHLTTITATRTQTVLSVFPRSSLRLKTLQYFLSDFWPVGMCIYNEAWEAFKRLSEWQASKWGNPLMRELWSAITLVLSQRKHMSFHSSHWPQATFLLTSLPTFPFWAKGTAWSQVRRKASDCKENLTLDFQWLLLKFVLPQWKKECYQLNNLCMNVTEQLRDVFPWY